MATVRVNNLMKKFGSVIAVNDVSFKVEDKAFLVLLGPSGCGKTTTLRCIAGLETSYEGDIFIGDVLMNEIPTKDRDLALVFQSYALYPHMNVFNNIAFPLKMRKVPKNEIKERVKRTAELLRITPLLDRKPKQLSGGEAQRTALGRAIVRDPKVFLMDEPISNLDAKLRTYMRSELKRLQKDLGVTTIYVTHDQLEAMSMADEIAIMNDGVLEQIGDTHEIFNSPANRFVASFIGSPPANFIDCTLTEKNGSLVLDFGTTFIPIPNNLHDIINQKETNSELILGVRPEDIIIGTNKTSDKYFETEVYITQPLGSEVIVDLVFRDKIIKVKAAPDSSMGIGEKVWMGFNKEKMFLFDKKSKKSII